MNDWPKDWKQQSELEMQRREQIRSAPDAIRALSGNTTELHAANAARPLSLEDAFYVGFEQARQRAQAIAADAVPDRGDDDLANAERVINGITEELFKRQDKWFAAELWRSFLDAKSAVLSALRVCRGAPSAVPVSPPAPGSGTEQKEAFERLKAEINNAIDGTLYAEQAGRNGERINLREHIRAIRRHLLKAASALIAARSAAPPAGELPDPAQAYVDGYEQAREDLRAREHLSKSLGLTGDSSEPVYSSATGDPSEEGLWRGVRDALRVARELALAEAERAIEALEPPMFNDESWLKGRDAALDAVRGVRRP